MCKRLILCAGLVLCLLVLAGAIAGCGDSSDEPQLSPTPATSRPPMQPALPSVADVVAKVKPSVVAINVEAIGYDFFRRPVREQGAGSGWIVSEDGYIVTNNHVVLGADTVTVTLDDGRVLSARDVRTDPLTDLAVIKVDAKNLPALDVGDSMSLVIGDWVVVIGNSLGRGISATQGIVSSSQVSLSMSANQTLEDLIQTDAAINPGNSGGPLVNMAGQVVGITSAKVAEVGVEGMGYAISSNEAMPIIEQLIETGYVVRPSLGASTATVTSWVASFYRLPVSEGVMITDVVRNGPADKAGLRAGDVITELDGTQICTTAELSQCIRSKQIGQSIDVTYWRARSEHEVEITLAESPPPGS